MTRFYRLCPHDAHTCTERGCLANEGALCRLASAEPVTQSPTTPPTDPTSAQAQATPNYDEASQAPTFDDCCYRGLNFIATPRSFRWVFPERQN